MVGKKVYCILFEDYRGEMILITVCSTKVKAKQVIKTLYPEFTEYKIDPNTYRDKMGNFVYLDERILQ